MVDDVETRLADGVQVHDVAVVGNEIVHLTNENAEGDLLECASLHPTGLTHMQGKVAAVERSRHLQRFVDSLVVIVGLGVPPIVAADH